MSRKILIADDNLTVRKQLEGILQEQGYSVVTVGNGELALLKMQDFQPHMVVIDIMMPGKSGYEVCNLIKNEPSLSQIPVILTFNENEPFDMVEARRVGAIRCLPKNIEADKFISILDFIWAGVTPIDYSQEEEIEEIEELEEDLIDGDVEFDPDSMEMEPVEEEIAEASSSNESVYRFEVNIEEPSGHTGEQPLDHNSMPSLEIRTEHKEVEIPGLQMPIKRGATIQAMEQLHPLPAPSPISSEEAVLEAPIIGDQFEYTPEIEENNDDLLHVREELCSSRCRECGAKLMTGDIFCIECGAALEEAVIEPRADQVCDQCQQAINNGDVFCLNCGTVL